MKHARSHFKKKTTKKNRLLSGDRNPKPHRAALNPWNTQCIPSINPRLLTIRTKNLLPANDRKLQTSTALFKLDARILKQEERSTEHESDWKGKSREEEREGFYLGPREKSMTRRSTACGLWTTNLSFRASILILSTTKLKLK